MICGRGAGGGRALAVGGGGGRARTGAQEGAQATRGRQAGTRACRRECITDLWMLLHQPRERAL
eukprot:CAMPEP_0182561198 /NCGR_PEP_ID=MMETSP1324-20130603/3726_1 /TAXON_ID=236786 /ORGANISM="Florenciella sp., Strain RCC1587" /LENGTH=63 /DNA_ID=CAMNT_0024773745 /DNA_START=36 /DNA_END=223 /DNA_ORIENTATION=-